MLPPVVCTSCGCEWDAEDGYYHTDQDEIIQPCRVCRCDSASIYYVNNAEEIREKKRASYYADLERKRAYYRNYRQQQRSQASA